MSKVATYLQEHILGEVTINPAILQAMSHDGSMLEITPEMVIYPRVTNDIRKAARFAWQLAEKGHILALTARGGGTDQTGAAIGRGMAIVFPAHMNRILELDVKQKLVRVQPGINGKSLNDALLLHGLAIPPLSFTACDSTAGGAVGNNASSPLAGKYGDMTDWARQLEVVLANGDLVQTQRLSKRELNRRKGLQTLEGEIYRGLDSLIEDNKQLIDEKLASPVRDNVGYSSIAKVKRSDGSFDLTPLITGSQGTLGIVSEMIMKTEFINTAPTVALIAFTTSEAARDALDQIDQLEPAFLEYYDGDLFQAATAQGKKYEFYKNIQGSISTVIMVGFDDFNAHARKRKLKRLTKLLRNVDAYLEYADGEDAEELLAVRNVPAYSTIPAAKGASAPPLLNGAYVPRERFEDFVTAIKALAEKYRIQLPFYSQALENILYARPILQLQKVGDKQKVFKIIDEYAALVYQHGGHLIAEDGEGRTKAPFAYGYLDDDVRQLFADVKALFDPYGVLNPGVKQAADVKELVSCLRSDYTAATFAPYAPYN